MRVGIIGLGALGSSLGLALRARKGWEDVTGYDASARVQNEAKRRGAIKEGTSDIPDLLSDADVVVLAVPAVAIIDLLRAHGASLRADTVVTDLASSKQAIVGAAERYVAARSGFVGGHPLVSCEPGIEHASTTLFRGRPWCLASLPGVPEDRVGAAIALVEAAGAEPYFVDAAEHDAWVAGVEQLPIIVAGALARIAGESAAWRELRQAAGRPFDEATRWAKGVAEEGRDLALTNGPALVSWLDRLQAELEQWREAVAGQQGEALAQRFQVARAARERWESERAKEGQGGP